MKKQLLDRIGLIASVLLLAVQLVSVNTANAANKANIANKSNAVDTAAADMPAPVEGTRNLVNLTLKDLGVLSPIRLVGADGRADVDFSFHTLDVVERLRLNVDYQYSPLLHQTKSSLIVLLNGHEVGTLPLTKESSTGAKVTLDIDPLMLQEWNHLTFRFLSHMEEPYCDDPRNKNLWVQFDQRYTSIEAETVTLPLTNDLSLFPMPFFDKHDIRELNVRFVLPRQPSWSVLQSAGILSSWFGSLAEWRKVRFPVFHDEIPAHDAIVLATVNDRIEGIKLPAVEDGIATIALVDNPKKPDSRLLLVVGIDEKGLLEAVRSLTLGRLALAGSSSSVGSAGTIVKRRPLDAPKWLGTEKKIRVGDLVKPEGLEDTAYFAAPFNMVMYLPPDLYRSETAWIPFDMAFESSNNTRYLHRMDALINGKVFQTELFDVPPPITGRMVRHRLTFKIPTWHLTGRDTLTVRFTFTDKKTELCTTAEVKDTIRVDPGSTIDLTQQQRFVELPNLSYLAYTGFPFSKMADLSETAVLLPAKPDQHEIEGMLMTLGHIGNKTGYPATAVTIDSVANAEKFPNKDILILGQAGHLSGILDKWNADLPVNPLADRQSIPYLGWRYMERWTDWGVLMAKLKRETGNPGMVLAGFQSPLQSGRSVVMLTAAESAYLPEEVSVLNTITFAKDFVGGVTLIDKENVWNRVSSFERSPRYELGELNLFEQAKRLVFHNPWLSVLFVMVITVFFASMVYRKMMRKTRERLSIGIQK